MKKAASLATLASLALLGVVLAYWSWAWLAPPAAARAPAAAEMASRTSSASGLFGNVNQGPGAAAAASSAVRLMGVVAASGGRRGHAVLRLDAKKTVAVLQGEDVEPGLRLAEVHVDHIVLERNGARETLAWPQKSGK
ncbi:MAG TPA: type II secretion system protein N [Burkholderiales bacterium]|nr:type II secretion system protein N [Burkholderiales bacterium]